MGWGYGIDGNGREVGYLVEATCDRVGCEIQIDRGLAYRCGPLGSETDDSLPGCGGFFCEKDLFLPIGDVVRPGQGGGFCADCCDKLGLNNDPCEECPVPEDLSPGEEWVCPRCGSLVKEVP